MKILPEDYAKQFDRVMDIGKQILQYQLSGKLHKETLDHFNLLVTQ